ncbi:hypothetical protein Tco_1122295 [Tanacetum coccineum]|uniref:Uncharacterized protein n=1 Tax=Tanacetum coccineum TaxID=301880 RepID=A0ABQ5J072_9ASTR
MMTRIAIRKKIICLLATYLHQKPKLLSRPQEVKEKEDEVSSDVPIHTIVMPIRITFDNPIDFNNHFSKPKDLKKDLTISFDSTSKSSILPPPLLDSDSPFTAELSASVTLNSIRNEDKVFKPVSKKKSFLLPPPEPPDECLNFESNLVIKNVVMISTKAMINPTISEDSRVRLIYPVLLELLILCVKLVWGGPISFHHYRIIVALLHPS